MKQHILPALKLTFISIIVLAGIYTLAIWVVAQAGPNHGIGETVSVNNKVVGYKLEGQNFTADNYFNSRPSAAGYNAAGSIGSNKGPSNPEYLKQVQDRVDTFLVHNPSIKKEAIPAELVTASGSGLDPDLSAEAAMVQVARISKARNISEDKLNTLVVQQTQKPLLGLFGTEKINILQLNIALDKLK
ncbi:K(+)-transporting ATPase subunit C [Ferruginibacter paludis]|uniref:K(+)-transporting ATPase subunit C n=1 Tax=Ferruginibacter paludis TaxID=1310417 RepID=UPI0025B43002|nr:K(+)-transporting ATPase subunit C [Ferruginibacter paludis]MDN3654607.1 K(+)-transporting ATPase subunit C [Ferruginibacter paludis]